MTNYRIAVMAGDGIGPEIVAEAIKVMQAAANTMGGFSLDFVNLPIGLSAYKEYGTTLPEQTLEELPKYHGWLLGPLTTHAYKELGNQVNSNGYLRKRFRLVANIRPAKAYRNVPCVHPNMDVVIIRENTEGFLSDRNMLDGDTSEMIPAQGVTLAMRVITEPTCRQLAHVGFRLARKRKEAGKLGRVSLIHKANVLRKTDGLFLDVCRDVASEYPEIEVNDYHVDATAMYLITNPERFDVIVTTNLFGDILSDEAAALVGGLGLAPGLNVGANWAMAQATHGSAPDIAGRGIANPIAEILSGAMLLEWLGEKFENPNAISAAKLIYDAVEGVIEEGDSLTPDLGGKSTTEQLSRVIIKRISTIKR